MADYKGIKGFTIQTIAGDPPAPIVGQVWYNTTSNVLKGYTSAPGAWAAGNALNTPRRSAAGAGTQTAGLAIAGAPSGGLTTNVEEYDGTSWTEVSNITGVARYDFFNAGTQTAALIAGGNDHGVVDLDICEIYDGSSWSETANLGTGRYRGAQGIGLQTAALAVGGNLPGGIQNLNEEFNGTSWTELADPTTPRYNQAAGGTSTAAIVMGGQAPATVGATETWDGTSWTEVNDMNTGRVIAGSALRAPNSTSLLAGGYPVSALTESWNGTCWTEVGDLGTGRQNVGACGIGTSALLWGGQAGPPPATTDATEEWSDPLLAVKTFTSS